MTYLYVQYLDNYSFKGFLGLGLLMAFRMKLN